MSAVPRAAQSAVGAYRTLLRSVASTFKGDDMTLVAARKEIRQKFDDNRNMGSGEALSDLINEAYDAADFIKSHVVQAEMNEQGHYAMKAEQTHADDTPPEGWVEPPPQKCS